jgi:hypothetical protein
MLGYSRKNKRVDPFWDLVRKASNSSVKTRPTFIRSWILDTDDEYQPVDVRENNFVKTSILVSPDGQKRLFSIIPVEFSMDLDQISMVEEQMNYLKESPPPIGRY